MNYELLISYLAKSSEMAESKAFVFSFILLLSQISPVSTSCAGTCIQSHKNHHEMGAKNWALTGHTFKTFSVSKVFDCHVGCYQERCRCRAFQIVGRQCELLDENRFTAPKDFIKKTGFSYFPMSLEYVTKVRQRSLIPLCFFIMNRMGTANIEKKSTQNLISRL